MEENTENKKTEKIVKKNMEKFSFISVRTALVIFGVVLFLVAIGGWFYVLELEQRFHEEKNLLNEELIKIQEEKLKAEKDTSICKSDIPGWRKDFFTTESVATTSDWNYFEKIDSDEKISFSMEYPEEWRRTDNRLFKMEHGVEEVGAMSIRSERTKLDLGQKCFDKKPYGAFTYINEEGILQSGLIKEDLNTVINNMEGAIRITKSKILGNDFYTYKISYCLAKKDVAFHVSFSERNEAEINEEFYKKILSTIEFEE